MTATPLTILHTESSCGWGGQEIRILTEAAALSARGHRVTLACPAEAPIFSAAQTRGLTVVALPIARKHWRGFAALRAYLQSRRDLDVINTHSSTDSWLAALACATLSHTPPIVRTRHVSTTIGNRAATRWLYQRATRHIVTTGEALKEQLVRDNGFDPARLTSAPTGIDLERFQPRDRAGARQQLSLDPARHYLGIVATLRNWKGHVYLLEAFRELAERFPDWDLLIVGDGPQRHNLERLIASLQLRHRITMPGNREDVERWFAAMDLFVLPSYGEEGVSQSVMQAMACGLPVISTTVGAIGEAVINGETGLLVPPRDTPALKAALAGLMQDATLRQQYAAAGLKRARERFSVERMCAAMETVFYAVTGKR
jgi:glycosyltransferase involved in cell wall biosynthesis